MKVTRIQKFSLNKSTGNTQKEGIYPLVVDLYYSLGWNSLINIGIQLIASIRDKIVKSNVVGLNISQLNNERAT